MRYGLEILHQRTKSVETKSQKVLRVNSNVCRSYWAKNFGRVKILIFFPFLYFSTVLLLSTRVIRNIYMI